MASLQWQAGTGTQPWEAVGPASFWLPLSTTWLSVCLDSETIRVDAETYGQLLITISTNKEAHTETPKLFHRSFGATVPNCESNALAQVPLPNISRNATRNVYTTPFGHFLLFISESLTKILFEQTNFSFVETKPKWSRELQQARWLFLKLTCPLVQTKSKEVTGNNTTWKTGPTPGASHRLV